MKKQERYHHFGVDWPGESFSESVTLCGVEGEDVGTGRHSARLCPGRHHLELLWIGTGEPPAVLFRAQDDRPFRAESRD